MSKRKCEFVIRYDSGAEVRVWAEDMTVTHDTSTGRVTEISWVGLTNPKPLSFGLPFIESVWMVK